jgi:hypothetical protein
MQYDHLQRSCLRKALSRTWPAWEELEQNRNTEDLFPSPAHVLCLSNPKRDTGKVRISAKCTAHPQRNAESPQDDWANPRAGGRRWESEQPLDSEPGNCSEVCWGGGGVSQLTLGTSL